MGHLDLIRLDLPDLTADGNVLNTSLSDSRISKVLRLIETHLIVKQDDKLAFDPLKYFLLTFAPHTLANLEFERKLLSFPRIVIAPYLKVFLVHTFELFAPSHHLFFGRLEDGVNHRIRTIHDTELLI